MNRIGGAVLYVLFILPVSLCYLQVVSADDLSDFNFSSSVRVNLRGDDSAEDQVIGRFSYDRVTAAKVRPFMRPVSFSFFSEVNSAFARFLSSICIFPFPSVQPLLSCTPSIIHETGGFIPV